MTLYLIIGGSASGKSAFAGHLAEQLAKSEYCSELRYSSPNDFSEDAVSFAQKKSEVKKEQDAPILYIATLADRGEESLKKVERHRELRKSGSYAVAECFSLKDLRRCCSGDPEQKLQKENMTEELPEGTNHYPVVLFDSLDGFTADVMFRRENDEEEPDQEIPPAVAAEKTVQAILELQEITEHLILVSDHFYSDGILYDEFTQKYMEFTSTAEQLLAEKAAYVVEVVCGIPVLLKGEKDELSEITDHHVVSLYEDSHAVS